MSRRSGIYTLEDFIVTSSSAGGTIGSIRSGEYSASGFGTVPPYAMTWNGHEVTFWDSAGDNAADWWPFSDLVNGSVRRPIRAAGVLEVLSVCLG